MPKGYKHKENCQCKLCLGIVGFTKGNDYGKLAKHNNKGTSNPMYGKTQTHQTREKIRNKAIGKRKSPETEFKKGEVPWNKGKRDYQRGIKKKFPEEVRRKLINNLKSFTGKPADKAYERILKECEELKKQGFRTIPIGKVIPDIIAIKDNKVFAVEVEYNNPNYNKYNQVEGIFDDVIWIIRRRDGKLS